MQSVDVFIDSVCFAWAYSIVCAKQNQFLLLRYTYVFDKTLSSKHLEMLTVIFKQIESWKLYLFYSPFYGFPLPPGWLCGTGLHSPRNFPPL